MLGVVRLLLSACSLLAASAQNSNYEGVKLFIVNYMTAFEQTLFNSSAVCFNQVTTTKLDADFVAMSKSLIFGRTEDFVEYYQIFLSDLDSALWACQVGDVRAAFDYNVKKHGFKYILGNVFWRALDIYDCSLKAIGDMMEFNYGGVATNLGLANRYVSPPVPANDRLEARARSKLEFFPGFINFTLGIRYGLDVMEQNTGPCFMALGDIIPEFVAVINDIEELAANQGNPTDLAIDIAQLITSLHQSAPLCQFNTFIPSIERLTWQAVLTNLANHWSFIYADALDLKYCGADVFKCGQNIGEIIRFTLSWGVYAPVPRMSGYDLLAGLIQGLEAAPNSADKCASDLTSLGSLYNQTVSDLQSLINGNYAASFALIADLKSLLTALKGDAADCNVSALLNILSSMLTPEGMEEIVSNFSANMGAIVQAASGLTNCQSDAYGCGLSVGEIFRLVLGWGI